MSVPAVKVVQDRMVAIEARFRAMGPVATGSVATTSSVPSRSFAAALTAAGVGASTAGPSGGDGAAVVAAAQRYLGVPYRWGGTDSTTGLDCSGFVQRVYADLGIELPRVSADQARAGQPVASLADARPGDLVAFDNTGERPGVDHIGIYIGDGRMIVAPRSGDVVREQEIRGTPVAIRRVLGDSTGEAARGPAAFDELFAAAGARHGVDPALLRAVARAESGFDPRAVSRAGASGLMQLMPSAARGLGVDPFDPAQAVDGAARLLAGHVRRFGSVPLALAAYNAGPGAVERHGGVPPYAETQGYVARVMRELTEEIA